MCESRGFPNVYADASPIDYALYQNKHCMLEINRSVLHIAGTLCGMQIITTFIRGLACELDESFNWHIRLLFRRLRLRSLRLSICSVTLAAQRRACGYYGTLIGNTMLWTDISFPRSPPPGRTAIGQGLSFHQWRNNRACKACSARGPSAVGGPKFAKFRYR